MNSKDPVDFFATLSLREIFIAAWSRRHSIWIIGLIGLLLAVLAVLKLPNRYVSNAQLLVRLGPGAVAMDPTAGLSQTVSLQESRLTHVNSVVELLRSKKMVERVSARVGPKRLTSQATFLPPVMDSIVGLLPKKVARAEGGLSAEEIKQQIAINEACKVVESDVEIYPAVNAYTINLEYLADSPFLARDVVAAFLEEYPKYHSDAHESSGSVEFFELESEEAFGRATGLQKQINELKKEHGIIELDSAKSALRQEMTQIQRDLNSVIGELSSVDAELQMLSQTMASMPGTIESETITGIAKPAGVSVRSRFYDLEVQAQELASKYKPDHPKRVAVESQLKAARDIANDEIGNQQQTREVVNPNLQSMDLAFRTANAKRSGLQAKKSSLETQREAAQRTLLSLNQVGATLTQLEWDASVAEQNYVETAQRLASARQIMALGNRQSSDVSVAQPATLELKKVGPKRGMLIVAALGLIGLVSVVQAAVRGLIWPDPMTEPNWKRQTADTTVPASVAPTGNGPAENPMANAISQDPSAFFESAKNRPR